MRGYFEREHKSPGSKIGSDRPNTRQLAHPRSPLARLTGCPLVWLPYPLARRAWLTLWLPRMALGELAEVSLQPSRGVVRGLPLGMGPGATDPREFAWSAIVSSQHGLQSTSLARLVWLAAAPPPISLTAIVDHGRYQT
jgi:hypothetical protein